MPPERTSVQARRFLIRGRVQGVGVRWFVERETHILGIAGWVRNNHDGSVEVLAMGTPEQLAGLRSRLREGPTSTAALSPPAQPREAFRGVRWTLPASLRHSRAEAA